ncbi:MAG: hypothetical protein ACRD2C_12270 [Acidimicrobiales bacterium]
MVGRVMMLAGLAVEAVAGFLPWIRTGQRERNGFELIDAARTLDVLESGVHRAFALAWYVVPLAATLCWLAVLLHRPRIGALLALTTGLLGLATAFSLEQTDVPTLVGVRAVLIAAAAVVAGAILELVEGGRHELVPEPR